MRAVLLAMVAAALIAGLVGGLLRAGVALPAAGAWVGEAVVAHAFLMISAFMGTVIGIERAVAVRKGFAYAAPLASGAAGLLTLAGATAIGQGSAVLAGAVFVAVNLLVVARQRAAHTVLLLIGALAWLVGNLLFALAARPEAVVPWWFCFLVLTIAAERLEMTRLMKRRNGAPQALYAILGAMLLGAAVSGVWSSAGGVLFGASLLGLAAWLSGFDIARRTVAAEGLSRYMALCLLLGYFWLAISGAAWIATALGLPWRDAALHALALGFVFSMMLGHAPVILPAVARVKLLFGPVFYVPLALLHGSLAVRLLQAHFDVRVLAKAAAGNAFAILLFAATVAGSAIAWRLKHRARPI